MNYDQFLQSIQLKQLPKGISIYLTAMWYDGCEQWEKAHDCVDSLSDATACWVHAYLHRKEGDTWNADYWYNRAKKQRPAVSLQDEWVDIVNALL